MRHVSIETIPVITEHLPFPKVIIFEIMAGCNLKCIMCPESQLPRPRGRMEMALFRKIVDEIAATNPSTEVWAPIMGEVFLLGDDIFDYVRYAKDAGLKNVYLNSKLVLFEPSMIRRLGESRLDKLTVGLDAVTSTTYERIRIDKNPRHRTNFATVEKNIEALIAARNCGALGALEIVLQFIVQDENAHEEDLFKKKWQNRGVTLKIRQKLGWGTAICAENLDLPNDDGRRVPCPWLMRTMSIHNTGRVAQCDALWDGRFYAGDLNSQSVKEVWDGELRRLRQNHLDRNFEADPCCDCKDWQCGLSEIIRG